MSVVLSLEGAKVILTWYYTKEGYNNPQGDTNNGLWLKLFTNDHTPTQFSTLGDFSEASGGGYEAKYLSKDDWSLRTVNGISQVSQPLQRWEFTAPITGGKKVVGIYVVDEIGNFIGAEKAPYNYTPEERGIYEVTPVVMLGNGDSEPPVINFFGADPPGESAEVTVYLNVSDNVGVTEYALGEDPNNFIWRTWSLYGDKTFVFDSDGEKILYAALKDEMGNISELSSIALTIDTPDEETPVIAEFTVPATYAELAVPVTLTATDNEGVTGYAISEDIGNPGTWYGVAPTEYVFTSGGPKIIYAFVRDAAGNVTIPVSRALTVTYTDSQAPSITDFSIPATSPSLTVPITLTAFDDIAIAEYSLNETNQPGVWVTVKPTEYTFATEGNKDLYAFVKDASGNISTSWTDATFIDVTDFVDPTVDTFTLPATSDSYLVPVTLVVSDDVAVVKYSLSEVDSPGIWVGTLPTEYTFSAQGVNTLYAFVKDAADNISVSVSTQVDITLPDSEAPVITAFVIPPSSASLTVPITLMVTDNTGVAAYSLSETASQIGRAHV